MKTFSLRIAICLAISFPLYTHADGCEYDTQCKGDRICENKICVSPKTSGHSVKPAEQAVKPAENSNSGVYGVFNKAPANPATATYFCCAGSEKLGPYPNPGSDGKVLHKGDTCSGITQGARHVTGRVCD